MGAHIDKLAKRLASAIFAIKKIRCFTNVDTARTVYFSYFHSLMSYGILLWGNAADKETIFTLQKRAIRSIYKLKPGTSLRQKFKEINILTMASQYIYENLLHVKKNMIMFPKNSDRHNINTRCRNQLSNCNTRLRRVNESFMGQCIRFYNKVPADIQDLPFVKFKTIVKSKLCAKGYYKITDYMDDKNPWA